MWVGIVRELDGVGWPWMGLGWQLVENQSRIAATVCDAAMRNICYKLRELCTVFEKIDPPLTNLVPPSTADKVSDSKRLLTAVLEVPAAPQYASASLGLVPQKADAFRR